MRTLVKFDDVLQEQLKNPEFKKCFDEAGAEYATFKNAMEARKEAGLTQEDIAERMGTTQSSVMSSCEIGRAHV